MWNKGVCIGEVCFICLKKSDPSQKSVQVPSMLSSRARWQVFLDLLPSLPFLFSGSLVGLAGIFLDFSIVWYLKHQRTVILGDLDCASAPLIVVFEFVKQLITLYLRSLIGSWGYWCNYSALGLSQVTRNSCQNNVVIASANAYYNINADSFHRKWVFYSKVKQKQ